MLRRSKHLTEKGAHVLLSTKIVKKRCTEITLLLFSAYVSLKVKAHMVRNTCVRHEHTSHMQQRNKNGL